MMTGGGPLTVRGGRCSDTADPTANATCSLTRDRIVAMSNAGTEAVDVTDEPGMDGAGAVEVGRGGAMGVGEVGHWM